MEQYGSKTARNLVKKTTQKQQGIWWKKRLDSSTLWSVMVQLLLTFYVCLALSRCNNTVTTPMPFCELFFRSLSSLSDELVLLFGMFWWCCLVYVYITTDTNVTIKSKKIKTFIKTEIWTIQKYQNFHFSNFFLK